MRVGLIGYSGERPPVGGVAGGGPVDPGDPPVPETPPEPLTLVLADGDQFRKAEFMALGYNRFDVLCIGAAGGYGGRIHQHVPTNAPSGAFIDASDVPINYTAHRLMEGGAPGGGGIHRVQGRLRLLPSMAQVVVGAPGADGPVQSFDEPFFDWRWNSVYKPPGTPVPVPPLYPARSTSDGAPGGTSSFGGTICRASGGEGGGGALPYGGAGGLGGKGGSSTPGGGPGGTYAPEYPGGPSRFTAGRGTWDGKIGSGGPGGSSQVVILGGSGGGGASYPGGAGAYSASDPSVSGPGGDRGAYNVTYDYIVNNVDGSHSVGVRTQTITPLGGAGGGAKPVLLNGDTTVYGSRVPGCHPEGLVIIRLTYEVL